MTETDATPYEVMEREMTPNPNAFKYIMNRPVIRAGAKSITSEEDAEQDPFAKVVFALGNIQSIYLSENFVTVSFIPNYNLEVMVEAVEDIIEDNLIFYDNEAEQEENKKESIFDTLESIDFPNLSNEAKAEVIDALLDETVRPALANDGGGVTVLDYEDNTLRIRYQGACGSCPSSQSGTLRAIENILTKSLKQEIRVLSSM